MVILFGTKRFLIGGYQLLIDFISVLSGIINLLIGVISVLSGIKPDLIAFTQFIPQKCTSKW